MAPGTSRAIPPLPAGEGELARSIESHDVGEGLASRTDIRDLASATPLTGSREASVRDHRLSRWERKIARTGGFLMTMARAPYAS